MPRERLRLPQQREKARWYPPNGQRLCSTHTSRVKVPADLGAPALFLVHFAAGWTAPSAWCLSSVVTQRAQLLRPLTVDSRRR